MGGFEVAPVRLCPGTERSHRLQEYPAQRGQVVVHPRRHFGVHLPFHQAVPRADRVGIKIAPGFTVNDTFDDDPAETYTYLARRLNPLGLAYLHVGYDSSYGRGTAPPFNPIDLLRPVYAGTLLAVGGFNKVTGEAALAAGRADAVVYARPFISNPDLVERFRLDAPVNPWDVRTFYGGDDHGYTDYPTLAEQGWLRKAP